MKVSKWFIAGLVTFMLVGCLQAEQDRTVTTKKVEELVQREIPIGTSKSQVIAFLDICQIEHSDYLEKVKAIYAIIRDTLQGTMVKGSIKIEFYFDDKSNLKDCFIKKVFTGP